MSTMLFEQLDDGETETPPPEGALAGTLSLGGHLYGLDLAEGGVLNASFSLEFSSIGGAPELENWGVLNAFLSVVPVYMYGPAVMPPATLAAELRITGGFPSGTFGYETENFIDASLNIYGLLVGGGAIPPPAILDDAVMMTSNLQLAEEYEDLLTIIARSMMSLSDRPKTRWEGVRTLRDAIAFEDRYDLIFRILLEDSLEFGDTFEVDHTAVERMIDRLLLEGVVNNVLEGYNLIADSLVFGAIMDAIERVTFGDTLTMQAALNNYFTGVHRLLDTLVFSDTVDAQATLVVALRDGMVFGDVTNNTLEAYNLMRDGLSFVLRLNVDDESYIAWSVNTTGKAATTYDNYPFNSFMKVGKKYYGVADGGVYSLGGATDDGADISARLRIGMSNMGNNLVKGVPNVYVGFAADGNILVKMVLADERTGDREAQVYRLVPVAAQSMREGVVRVGRGFESVYWDCVIENVDGSDFEIDKIEFRPVQSTRRVRGNGGGP